MEFGRNVRFSRTAVIIFIILVVIFILYLLVGSGSSKYVDKTVKISELLSASIFLAEEAGKAVVEVRKNTDANIATKVKNGPSGREYVTMGDQKSHAIISKGLNLVWPTLKYKSEEKETREHLNVNSVAHPPLHHSEVSRYLLRDETVDVNDVIVWIDPLDATQEYTEGGLKPQLLKYVTVMICIVVKDEPIASVIHQPFVEGHNGKGEQGMTFWSWINHGVSPNIIRGTDISSSNVIRLISSRSHSGNVKKTADRAFNDKDIRHITAAGAGYKALQVAQDKADLYFHTTHIKKWDTCAGDALISAMGGVMTTRKGNFITYSAQDSPEITDGLICTRSEKKHKLYFDKLKRP